MDISEILRQVAVSAVPILLAITFHEVAHGYVAYRLGDPTAKSMGRLTLNPLAHIDPVGTVLLPVIMLVISHGQFMFGYAKPVPINPRYFKNPPQGMALSAAAGPLCNIALAVACLLAIKFILLPAEAFVSPETSAAVLHPIRLMLISGITMNIVLASFNLIPIPPLDGGRIAVGLLPHSIGSALSKLEPFGMIIVMLLIMTGASRVFMAPLIYLIRSLLSFVGGI